MTTEESGITDAIPEFEYLPAEPQPESEPPTESVDAVDADAAAPRVAKRSRLGWIVPLVFALVGSLIGGGIVAALDKNDSNTVIRFGNNSSVIARAKDVQGILAKVEPAVVSVRTEAFQRGGFFSNEVQRVRGAGTGMILTATGDVLTNNHVVEGASSITVTLEGDAAARPADLVSRDPVTDVAIIRIRDASGLPTVKLGESGKLAVGDDVLAIGNALDLVGGPTVTRGIVSALNRSLPSDTGGDAFAHLIQTDAAINNGNSGGPLVNAAGEVVGMNTVVIQATGSGNLVQNIGFAIAIDSIKPNLDTLKNGKAPAHPTTFLGATLATVTDAIKQRLGLATGEGVLVNDVVAGSPAENAGLQAGDVITKFDGKSVKDAQEVVDAVKSHKSGDKVSVEYLRGNDKKTATVTLGSRQLNSA